MPMPPGLRSFADVWSGVASTLGTGSVRSASAALQPAQVGLAHAAGNETTQGTVLKEQTPAVYAAISACTKSIGKAGISKDRRNQQQGYAFRGIDDVYNTLSAVLAEHQLCIIPRVIRREVTERNTAKGGVLFYVVVEVEFDIVSAVDGSTHMARVFGEAMDSADKATNKAMSAAYKYMALQLFCIPTESDNDADATTHDVAPISPTKEAWNRVQPEQQNFLRQVSQQIVKAMHNVKQAHEIISAAELDQDHKAALWHLLDSGTRRALKETANV